jgi:tRNA(Ile)-lysidine synthase
VCAVSGGPDSCALLVLAVASGCRAVAVHVDHGLRTGGGAEADQVATLAGRLGARFERVAVEVGDGPNLEARARDARLAALPVAACFGHTADDQAETMLLNLMRGAALDGLAGMRAGPRHPILGLRRAETTALCAHLGIAVVADPSNTDPRFLRNRVRHELLPLLAELSGRDVVPVLSRQAAHLRAVGDLLESQAAPIDPTDAPALRGAPAVLAAVALRRWLREAGDGHPPDSATLERVLAVARGEAVAADVGLGVRVARTAGRLRLERAGERRPPR